MNIQSIRDNIENLCNSGYTMNRFITIDEIFSNPDVPWSLSALSYRQDITADIILAHPEIEWDYEGCLLYGTFTVETAQQAFPDMDLDDIVNYLSENFNISASYILDTYDKYAWDSELFIKSVDLPRHEFDRALALRLESWIIRSSEINCDYLEANWEIFSRYAVKLSAHCPMEILLKYPDASWYARGASKNPRADPFKNPDFMFTDGFGDKYHTWDYEILSRNYFNYDKIIKRIITQWREWIRLRRITKIQRWWRHHCYSPARQARTDTRGRQLAGFEGFARTHLFH